MKKILLFFLSILAVSQLQAQQINHYYNYANSLYQADVAGGTPWEAFVFCLFPDSTVEENDGNGAFAVQNESDGQAFDPTDPNFSISNSVLTPYMSYTVDSIFFGYNYQRYQNAAPDTALVQIYNESEMLLDANPGFTSGASFATVGYSSVTRAGINAVYSQKLLLTSNNASATLDEEDYLSVPVNIIVPAGDKIATTITYLPGNPYSVGDTIDPSLSPTIQINCFQLFDYSSTKVEPSYYNNELTVDPTVRYNINQYGWDSLYIPGTAYGDTVYNLDMQWYVTFDSASLSVQNIPLVSNTAIYPNPSSVNSTANLVFSLVNDDDLTIDVTNDAGVRVLSFNKQHFQAGVNNFEINTANLPAGIYICNIAGTQGNQSLKLAIQ